MSTDHARAAALFLKDSEKVDHHDQTFWSVREKRDHEAFQLPEWEDLRNAADALKRHTVTHLADYLEAFERHATENGVIVHWARDAREYLDTVYDILHRHGVRKVVKSKSMLTEECGLNPFLEQKGIEVVETDLGERILQLMHLKPAHIVMPAIHITRRQVSECFQKEMGAEPGNDDPTYLTRCARESLRAHFLTAEAGMTGANFGIAETGDVVVCTNEGNADMSTAVPKLHIVSMGIEKVIPDYEAMGVMHRLLARCGTGQATTVYTSHFRKPRPGGEMHIILVDNGRSDILGNREHWETLKCLRCGACMNTCPVYRRSGGYSYTYFIPGPIGINLGMLRDAKRYAGNVSACSLCCSCDNVCPAKVNLSQQIYLWRQQMGRMGTADRQKKLLSEGMSFLFNRPSLYRTALRFAPIVNRLPRRLTGIHLNAWARGREMPQFAQKSFHRLWKEEKQKQS